MVGVVSPIGFLIAEFALMACAFVVATIKSHGGLLDWVKWFGGVWFSANVAWGVLRFAMFLIRTFGGGGDAA